jgi:PmbA protein
VLIDGGVLQRFVHNAYTARRAGTTSTGNAVRGFSSTPGVGCRALSLVPGTKAQEELLAEVGEGVLVSSVSGLHSGVNPVSGDFSTGAEGLRISGGELASPCGSSPSPPRSRSMLGEVAAVGPTSSGSRCAPPASASSCADVTVSGS